MAEYFVCQDVAINSKKLSDELDFCSETKLIPRQSEKNFALDNHCAKWRTNKWRTYMEPATKKLTLLGCSTYTHFNLFYFILNA